MQGEEFSDVLLSSSPQHSVDIVHIPGRRPFGQNLVTIYIDGEQCKTAQLRFPSLNEVKQNSVENGIESIVLGQRTSFKKVPLFIKDLIIWDPQ